ncbi:MAG: hypothetical protein CL908_20715 [Deltaproteobacteria bacterium]|nr:hypothetical protein [Deltaproteobacteria bacterium]
MYTAFYGLREKPFALSPDPRFLYLAGSHREALAHLLYGIEQGEGFISVTGEVGTGKTTLCRTLLERLDGAFELAFLFNPSRTGLELLQSICAEFGLPAEGLPRRSLMVQLNNFLVEQKRAGRRVLLIIDEAQTLSDNTLEQVRLLSNLETSREKLIQILLLGQPELDRKLDGRALRQLRQRISVRWKLEPLGSQETHAYVRHRIAVATGEPKDLFSEAALREIHRRTGGVPRLVNQLCDRALLAGYAARAPQIGPRLIRAAASEIPDTRHPRRSTGRHSSRSGLFRPWMFGATSLGLVGLALLAGLHLGRNGLTDAVRASLMRSGRSDASEAPGDRDSSGRSGAPTSSPPAVAANAPAADPALVGDGHSPPLARLIGFVPPEIRENLSPTPGQLGDPRLIEGPGAFVAAEGSLAIPPRPAPMVTTVAQGLLPRLIRTRPAPLAMAESGRVVLERFGRAVSASGSAPTSERDLQASFERHGLSATPFDGGSIDLLRRLDHPVLLPLAALDAGTGGPTVSSRADRETSLAPDSSRWVAIVGFDGDRALVAGLLGGQIASIPLAGLEAHWLETGIIVWERFERFPTVLAEGDQGRGVLWLQRALAELHHFEAGPSGSFDNATRDALRDFQRARGLIADGVAGPLTQIALYAELPRYSVPRLSTGEHAAGSRGGLERAPDPPQQTVTRDSDRTAPAPGDRG